MALAFAAAVLIIILVRVPLGWIEPVVVAFVVRAMVALLHFQFAFLPDSQFDAIRFEQMAWLWAKDGKCFDDFTTGSLLYSWLGSCVYVALGRTELLLQFINAMLGTLVVILAMKSGRLLALDSGYIRKIGWFAALHPSLILYSAITMREASIVFAFGVALYWLVRWRTTQRYCYLALSVVAVLVSQLFHTGMVAASAIIVCIGLIYVVREHSVKIAKIRFTRTNVLVTMVTGVLVTTLVMSVGWAIESGFAIDKLQRLLDGQILESIVSWQADVARGRASYLDGFLPESWLGFLWQVPVRSFYFLGAPFPWQLESLSDLWGFVDGATFLYVCWIIGRNSIKGAQRQDIYRVLLVVALSVIVAFSVATSNYGTAFRHRAKFVPLLLVLLMYGSSLVVRSKQSPRSADR